MNSGSRSSGSTHASRLEVPPSAPAARLIQLRFPTGRDPRVASADAVLQTTPTSTHFSKRSTPVLATVTRVLERANRPLPAGEIPLTAEGLAGQPLLRASVEAAPVWQGVRAVEATSAADATASTSNFRERRRAHRARLTMCPSHRCRFVAVSWTAPYSKALRATQRRYRRAKPSTATGRALDVRVPSPNWPWSLFPQHLGSP